MAKTVLHVINDLAVGGSEIMLLRLLSRTDRDAFEPVVLALKGSDVLRQHFEALDVRVFTAGMSPRLPSPAAFVRVGRVARQVKPELIHGWMYHGNLAAQYARACLKTDVPVLWGVRNSLSSARNAKEKTLTAAAIRLCAMLSRRPQGIIYVSQANRAQHEAFGFVNSNSHVVPNGFDTECFAPSPVRRAEVRRELGVADNEILIGLFARFHESKDHDNFLRAASRLARGHRNVRFVLCGKAVDNRNSFITRLANDLDLRDNLQLLGPRLDVARLMTGLDIFASSSCNESFNNVVGEAMSSAVPCVATDVGEVANLLGETGIVVPPRDPDALSKGLESMMTMESSRRLSLGHAARRRIADHFSLDSIVRQYQTVYEETIARFAVEKT